MIIKNNSCFDFTGLIMKTYEDAYINMLVVRADIKEMNSLCVLLPCSLKAKNKQHSK